MGRLRIKKRGKVWANNIQEAFIGKRHVEISPELAQMLQENRERFIEKFGREPGPQDPLFFDPESDSPEPVPYTEDRLRQELTDACKKAGFDDEKTKGILNSKGGEQCGAKKQIILDWKECHSFGKILHWRVQWLL